MSSNEQSSAPEFPAAAVRPAPRGLRVLTTHAWWVALLCLVAAIVLTVLARPEAGVPIRVTFPEGHGLKAGDAVEYRGIQVGAVSSVELAGDAATVIVAISLVPNAERLAREGSRFWIERPQFSLKGVRALETAIGAKYVGVLPGPAGGPPRSEFVGLERAPALDDSGVVDIAIRFREAYGLAAGDELRYRGMVVGEVTDVRLAGDLGSVSVTVRLAETATAIARAGSLFWVERPRVGITEIRGLETLVGGRFLAVAPGPSSAEPRREFEGLDEAPAELDRTEGGLEVILRAKDRFGLERGSPVLYRGIRVGRVTSVNLASDAARVEARAYVEPQYRALVRPNTRFWAVSGIDVDVGISGVKLDLESLATVIAGGVAFATPNVDEDSVVTGHPFTLDAGPPKDWHDWEPPIPVGDRLLPGGVALPHARRATLRWRERNYVGWKSARQREAWVLVFDRGLLGLGDFFAPVEDSIDGEIRLAIAGEEFPVAPESLGAQGAIVYYPLASTLPAITPWPRVRVRTPANAEDALVVADPQGMPFPLAVGQIASVEADHWRLEPSVPLDPSWHGGVVVSRRDGALVGLLQWTDDGGRVLLFAPPE